MRVSCGWSMLDESQSDQFNRVSALLVQGPGPASSSLWLLDSWVFCDGFQSRGSALVFYEAVDPVCP